MTIPRRTSRGFLLLLVLASSGCGKDGPAPREQLVEGFSSKHELRRRCVAEAFANLPDDLVDPFLDGVADRPMAVELSPEVLEMVSDAFACPPEG